MAYIWYIQRSLGSFIGKSCFCLSGGLKGNVTETLEKEQTFVYVVIRTQIRVNPGDRDGCVCAEEATKDKEMEGKTCF